MTRRPPATRLAFTSDRSPAGVAVSWDALGVTGVIELEESTLGALRRAARRRCSTGAEGARVVWLDLRSCDLHAPEVQQAIVAAMWRVFIRPEGAVAISDRMTPTSLRVVGAGPVCRRAGRRAEVWRPTQSDALVANLATLVNVQAPDRATLSDVAAWLHANERLDVTFTRSSRASTR